MNQNIKQIISKLDNAKMLGKHFKYLRLFIFQLQQNKKSILSKASILPIIIPVYMCIFFFSFYQLFCKELRILAFDPSLPNTNYIQG